MTPDQIAEWWQTATNEQRVEFCSRIGGLKVQPGSYWIYTERTPDYSMEAAAREARTVIPEGRASKS